MGVGRSTVLAGVIVAGCTSMWSAQAQAEGTKARSRVYLNGVPSQVHFNDGDSFEVLAGEHKGTRARLSGFNTLESHGAVHRWGNWHEKELYNNAKQATLNARRGVWNCESDGSRDTYGRVLWFCLDLAIDQVRKGLAHAMTVTTEPAHPDVLEAQLEAIANRRGMWAHGVPAFVMTSVHSADEPGSKKGVAYNRVVSTRDGHSASTRHTNNYKTCDWACTPERQVPDDKIIAARKLLAQRAEELATTYADHLERITYEYAILGYFVGIEDAEHEKSLLEVLKALDAEGAFGDAPFKDGACVLHVPFEQRFRAARAGCLK